MQKKSIFYRLPFGLRTVKTGLAVTLALFICRFMPESTPFYAALGAISAMDRTLADSLRASATQLVGLLCGSLFGFLLVHFIPNPPFWLIGIGIILLITICNYGRIPFTTTLSCLIFISICTTPESSTLLGTALRLRDTAVGLILALVVNALIQPYNNSGRLLRLLSGVPAEALRCLEPVLLHEQYPDLQALDAKIAKLHSELHLFRRQHILIRRPVQQELAYFEGCLQLAARVLQEMEAIACMDSFGAPTQENLARLRARGMALPETEPARKGTAQDETVMNYHMSKLLDACDYLEELLREA